MAYIHFVASLMSALCIQWTLSEKEGVFEIHSGKCEEMEPEAVFNLSNMSLTRIGNNLISFVHPSCLLLRDNQIVDVSNRAFDLLPNLLYLDVSNNQIAMTDLFCVGAGTNIITLVLDNNRKHGDDQNNDNPYIHNPYMYRNHRRIMTYPDPETIPTCSMDFLNLQHLYVRGCNFRNSIPSLSAPKLTHLYLSSNNIASVQFIKRWVHNLTHLYLHNNDIQTFTIALPHVLHLDLSFNRIAYLCHEYCTRSDGLSFVNTRSLQYLSLANNNISSVESDTFWHTLNLTVLDLSNNNIVEFREKTFDSLKLLQNLSLSHNSLAKMPNICSLSSLIYVNLSFNSIDSISTNCLCHTVGIQILDLSNNLISYITDDTFKNFTSLEYLNLFANDLRIVDENWIAPLSNLRRLYIGGNNFENLASVRLSGATILTDLYFDKNTLTTVSVADLINISNNVSLHFTKHSCREPNF